MVGLSPRGEDVHGQRGVHDLRGRATLSVSVNIGMVRIVDVPA
jgi:hypothetical protein